MTVSDQSMGVVGLLYGGISSEREISLQSGAAVAESLARLGIDTHLIDVGADLIDQLRAVHLDRAFIALHGAGGEDGTVQAVLETLAIPYSGSGVLASALSMDKLRCKQLWRGLGLPTADFMELSDDSNWAATLDMLGGCAMVKPSREGSSIGMSRADSSDELARAWQSAVRYQGQVFAESRLRGEEYTVAIVAGQPLPSIRLQAAIDFYDFKAKYHSNTTQYFCPSGLSEESEAELMSLCVKAFQSLDCRGWGRVDVMMDEDQNFYLLEVNTVPGMTKHSLVPKAAAAAGISFDQLVYRILEASGT